MICIQKPGNAESFDSLFSSLRLALSEAVPTSKGHALADEYGIKFFETSANTNLNVEQVLFSIRRDIKQRLAETDSKAEPATIKIYRPGSKRWEDSRKVFLLCIMWGRATTGVDFGKLIVSYQ